MHLGENEVNFTIRDDDNDDDHTILFAFTLLSVLLLGLINRMEPACTCLSNTMVLTMADIHGGFCDGCLCSPGSPKTQRWRGSNAMGVVVVAVVHVFPLLPLMATDQCLVEECRGIDGFP